MCGARREPVNTPRDERVRRVARAPAGPALPLAATHSFKQPSVHARNSCRDASPPPPARPRLPAAPRSELPGSCFADLLSLYRPTAAAATRALPRGAGARARPPWPPQLRLFTPPGPRSAAAAAAPAALGSLLLRFLELRAPYAGCNISPVAAVHVALQARWGPAGCAAPGVGGHSRPRPGHLSTFACSSVRCQPWIRIQGRLANFFVDAIEHERGPRSSAADRVTWRTNSRGSCNSSQQHHLRHSSLD